MKRLIAIVLLLGVLGFGASQAWSYWNFQVYTPVSGSSQPVNFKVSTGESAAEVASDLQTKGLIRSASVFNWYLKVSGSRGGIQAGDFVLNRNMNMPQLIEALAHGHADQVAVQMPEGIAAKFMAQAVQDAGIGPAQAYLDATKDPAWMAQYDFLGSKPKDRDLEGYLYPDTYSLNRGATPKDLVKAQLDRFSAVFNADLRQAIKQPTDVRPAESVDTIVILASMVDREVNKADERARVCGIFYNRLKIHEKLGVDATILYAQGRLKGPVTDVDLQINSPYNTRKFAGLPPGPIGNPTESALRGCVNPEKSDYLFYFTDKSGKDHFEKSLAEFNADIAKYGVSGE